MIVSNIRDEPHRITQFELILNDDEVRAGLDHMDPSRRAYAEQLMRSSVCSARLAGYLEIAQAVEESEWLALRKIGEQHG